MSTTVLATAMAIPITAPDSNGRSNSENTAMAKNVATRLCPTAPGTATDFTASRSFK
jgi:hypothetical protein